MRPIKELVPRDDLFYTNQRISSISYQNQVKVLQVIVYTLCLDRWPSTQKDMDGVLLRCIDNNKIKKFLEQFHDIGGHFSPNTTAYKIMRVGYYWHNLFSHAHAWVRKCKQCALFFGKERLVALPLCPILINQPFLKWGNDFVGPINQNYMDGHKRILTTIDYFTNQIEAIALKEANKAAMLNFHDDLVCMLGVPNSIISNNALSFVGTRINEWALKNGFYLNTSSNYYPQGNGLAKITNKNC